MGGRGASAGPVYRKDVTRVQNMAQGSMAGYLNPDDARAQCATWTGHLAVAAPRGCRWRDPTAAQHSYIAFTVWILWMPSYLSE